MDSITVMYVTCSADGEAKKIASALLEKKLVACANMFPIKSMYGWEGKMADDSEVVLLLKTSAGLADSVEKEVKALHSYKVPCVLRFSAGANREYAEWAMGQVNPSKGK